MEIRFIQKAVSLKDKGKVYVDGRLKYQASKKFFSIFPELYLKEADTENVLVTINKHWAFFVADYTITLADGSMGAFKTAKFWKGVFSFSINGDNYDLYTHRGRKYSIFKNDKQIAYWSKGMVTVLEGDEYKVLANNDADDKIVTALLMTFDNYKRNGRDRSLINFDFGSLLQDRPFDTAWVPSK